MTPEEREVIIEVLCGQSLADHLGDVRDEEDKLWKLLGIPPLPHTHSVFDRDRDASAYTFARLKEAGEALPGYYGRYEEEEDDDE